MRWTDYPTRTDYVARANGVERSGSEWSDAPKGKWVVPDGVAGCVNVLKRQGEDRWYRILAES
jgi:hypothetical protein